MTERAPKPAKPPTRTSPQRVTILPELKRLAYETGVLGRKLDGLSNILTVGLKDVSANLDEILALLRR